MSAGNREVAEAKELADIGAALGSTEDAGVVLDGCLTGDVPEANAFPQLKHLHEKNPRSVLGALCDKTNVVISNAQNRKIAMRAGALLVNAAFHLDGKSASGQGGSSDVSRGLLEHVLLAGGGAPDRAPKDQVVRAQTCALVAQLAAVMPSHKGAEAKLLQFAQDKVPSIREKAVRGLAAIDQTPAVERALAGLTTDLCTAVRASAVRALRVGPSTAPALLSRINDVEACVRVQLFNRLLDQPEAVDSFGAASLARLVVGLVDRSHPVRAAAGAAVDAWRERLGNALNLISRCDITDDEALGEAIAGALAHRYPLEGAAVAREWLRSVTGGKRAKQDRVAAAGGVAGALFARMAIASMKDEERDEFLDVPALVERTHEALDASPPEWRRDVSSQWTDFLLRTLLHIVAAADVCDEVTRREVEKLAEAVLLRAPIPTGAASEAAAAKVRRQPYSAIDLAVVILRQCSGLSHSAQARTRKHQAMENNFSVRMVLLISDLCQPYEGGGDGEASFAGRLSRQLHQLQTAIDELKKQKAQLNARKKKAIAEEDFMLCHELKGQFKRNDDELAGLQEKATKLQSERDSVCLRVTAMITALLRWSSSNLRMDPALFGTLQTILQPMVTLPALSEDVDIAAITAICLFCTRDGATARQHWPLLLQLVRNLREGSGNKCLIRARAAVAARTLADCARLHGDSGQLDRDEVLGAALSLAAVPFRARHVVLEPLCGWLLSLGHIFFEEHLLEPVLEVQWALGWMLVEAFRQRSADSGAAPEEEAEEEVETAMAMQLTQFFSLLPKLPGKQGAPMLSLAVESVAETGLWRKAVLQPHSVGFHTRFIRTFSWPMLFTFAHERSPPEMRFRLWKCALQLCVTSPALAPLAEVPHALDNVIKKGEAPPGATELVREAIRLGADPADLVSLAARLPPVPEGLAVGGPWLLPRAEAEACEKARREALASIGIVDLESWAPSTMGLPEVLPQHIRMRQAGRGTSRSGRTATSAAGSVVGTSVVGSTAGTPIGGAAVGTPVSQRHAATPLEMPAPETPTAAPAESGATPGAKPTPAPKAASKRGPAAKGQKRAPAESMPPPAAPPTKGRRINVKSADTENAKSGKENGVRAPLRDLSQAKV